MDADRRPLAFDYDAGRAGLGKRRHRIGGAPQSFQVWLRLSNDARGAILSLLQPVVTNKEGVR